MASPGAVRKVIVVGGGADAWLAALALMQAGGGRFAVEVLVPQSGAAHYADPRAAESTLPPLRALHRLLGIDEDALIRATGGTFKLGTEFVGWGAEGSYIQPCGEFGAVLNGVAFHQHLARLRAAGTLVHPEKYCLAALAGRAGRFTRPAHDPTSVLSTMSYGLHLDARQYAGALMALAQSRGVSLVRDELCEVQRDSAGAITALLLGGGGTLSGDLFLDASGSAALLIGRALGVPFMDWSALLPCSRFVEAVLPDEQGAPLTRVAAADFGWMWQIPLQGRTHIGYAFDPALLDDEAAGEALLKQHSGRASSVPLSFHRAASGRRVTAWKANCIAVGAAAGFVEPLEATERLTIQSTIVRLLSLFPEHGTDVERAEYDRLTRSDLEGARDLAALHYLTGHPAKNEFWRQRASVRPPESLGHKITQFLSRGRVVNEDEEAFPESAWLAVLLGQGLWPRRCEALADAADPNLVRAQFARIRDAMSQTVAAMPSHADFMRQHGLRAQHVP